MGTSIGILSTYAGATYDFGILKAYAQYINTKYTSNLDSNTYITRSAQQIGVRSFVTPTIEVWASGGTGKFRGSNITAVTATGLNAFGTNTNPGTANFTGYQLGSNYLLIKRTNLYAIFGSTQASTNGANAAEGGSSYGVGVRHTF